MMQNQQGFQRADLILRYMRNELDEAGTQELFNWLDKDPANKAFFEKLMREEGLRDELAFFSSTGRGEAWKSLRGRIATHRIPLWKRKPLLAYAASVAFLLVAGFSAYYLFRNTGREEQNIAAIRPAAYIQPGGNKALLTLGDGRQIPLDDAATGELARQADILITKASDGQVVYQVKSDGSTSGKYADQINTITTPRGGQYQVVLPDGSKVWLNAMSSLRYPASFTAAKQRRVELTGEAYFEVAKDKSRPFLVVNSGQTIEVLGTRFNMNAYPDEADVKTTLLEGSVRVNAGGAGVTISPGQQAVSGNGNGIAVTQADTEEAIAWVKGNFVFNSQELGSIMRSVARWYDTDIDYADKELRNKKFTGAISRYKDVSEVLHMLELTNLVHFKVEGRRIIIMK